jgi:glyoxylase-like metal-dependent hydrolase (beta-lactamase superfamily II)
MTAANTSVARIGPYTITRIEEMLTPGFRPEFLFPDFDAQVLQSHPQLKTEGFWHAGSERLMSSMHSWLLQSEQHTILIDTGCGNLKTRALPLFERFHQLQHPYLERLRAAGVAPEDVTLVINTHLHVDHVGWNTRLEGGRWVPTFPRARYIWGAAEWAHWSAQGQGSAKLPENLPVIADSVQPVVDAGLSELADDISTVLPGLSLQSLPGHTAGQMMVVLDDGQQCAVFPGDALHQPLQVYRPDWNSRFCEDAQTARHSRHRLLEFCAERQALLFPAHFGAPHAGCIRRKAAAYSFEPVQ